MFSHIYIRTYVCMYCMYVCVIMHIHVCTYVCTYMLYVCMYVRMYVHTYVCMCVCMCVCVFVCMYVLIWGGHANDVFTCTVKPWLSGQCKMMGCLKVYIARNHLWICNLFSITILKLKAAMLWSHWHKCFNSSFQYVWFRFISKKANHMLSYSMHNLLYCFVCYCQ